MTLKSSTHRAIETLAVSREEILEVSIESSFMNYTGDEHMFTCELNDFLRVKYSFKTSLSSFKN